MQGLTSDALSDVLLSCVLPVLPPRQGGSQQKGGAGRRTLRRQGKLLDRYLTASGAKQAMQSIWSVVCSCKTLFATATAPGFGTWEQLAAVFDLRPPGAAQAPTYQLLAMHMQQTCRVCHVQPAPVRWGLRIRCCSWCFEQMTVPATAVVLLNTTTPLDSVRSDYRYVGSHGRAHGRHRERVYFLPDLLRHARCQETALLRSGPHNCG